MGLRRRDVFCTAFPEKLQTGENFIETIRQQMQECDTVISLITAEYLQSPFCLVEMGAAWALCKQYFPLLTVKYEELDRTPLKGIQMRKLDEQEDLSVVYDELHRCKVLEDHSTAEFYRRTVEFVSYVKKWIAGDYVLHPDEEGYYETVIESVRELSQKQYRCYGIKGVTLIIRRTANRRTVTGCFYWGPNYVSGIWYRETGSDLKPSNQR